VSRYEGNAYSIEEVKLLRDKHQPSRKVLLVEKDKRVLPSILATDNQECDKKCVPNVSIIYNLSNEPCLRYSLEAVDDQGFDEQQYTSYRLHRDVLFLETKSQRF
jgi:hypothetical protein